MRSGTERRVLEAIDAEIEPTIARIQAAVQQQSAEST